MLFPLRSSTWQYDIIITPDISHIVIIIIASPGWRAPLPLVSHPGLCWYTPPSPSHSSRYKHRSKQQAYTALSTSTKVAKVARILWHKYRSPMRGLRMIGGKPNEIIGCVWRRCVGYSGSGPGHVLLVFVFWLNMANLAAGECKSHSLWSNILTSGQTRTQTLSYRFISYQGTRSQHVVNTVG